MRRVLGTARRDEGFGLIEMVVALLIAGIVFSALATTLISSVRASLFSRQNQQATDYMTQAVEELRLLSYGSLSVSASALGGDPRVITCPAGPLCIHVDGSDEAIVTAAVPGVTAVQTLHDAQTNGTTFTLHRYVTAVNGTGTDLVRRVTVTIAWTLGGKSHERTTSTVIAYSQRGLPLPYFTLKPATSSVSINPSATAVHTFTLENKGAPDRWNLTLTGSTAGLALYADTDNSGDFDDDGTDVLLSDTSADGIVDTGRIQPGTTFRFYLVRTTTASTPLATLTTTVTAKSVAQPTATTATATATATTVILSGAVAPTVAPTPTVSPTGGPSPSPSPTEVVCAFAPVPAPSKPGYTSRSYALHNKGLTTSTTLSQLDMNVLATTNVALGTYSTDQSTTLTGRQVVGSASTTSAALLALSGPTTYADWSMDLGAKLNIAGEAVVQVWVAAPAGAVPSASVQVVLYSSNSAGGSRNVIAARIEPDTSAPYTTGAVTAGCAGFQQVAIVLPSISAQSVGKNNQLHVRLAVSSPLRLGYDTTTMPATIAVNVK